MFENAHSGEPSLDQLRSQLERAQADKLTALAEPDSPQREGKLRALNDVIANLQANIDIVLEQAENSLREQLSAESVDNGIDLSSVDDLIDDLGAKLEAGEALSEEEERKLNDKLRDLYSTEQQLGRNAPKELAAARGRLITKVRDVNDALRRSQMN